jgi:hypothetical protein
MRGLWAVQTGPKISSPARICQNSFPLVGMNGEMARLLGKVQLTELDNNRQISTIKSLNTPS